MAHDAIEEKLKKIESKAWKAGDPEDDLGMDVYWREQFLDLIEAIRILLNENDFYRNKDTWDDGNNSPPADYDQGEEARLARLQVEKILLGEKVPSSEEGESK